MGGGQINRSYSYGSISGLGIVGGITGEAEVNIISSASIVELDGFVSIGGLAGWISNSVIQDSYSHGTVSADAQGGGLVGLVNFTSISKSYSATIVNSEYGSGGFSGINEGNIEDCYWNTEIANQQLGNSGGNSAGLTALTTEQMTGTNAFDNMVALDYTSIWKLTDSYPVLEWEYSVDFLLKPDLTEPEDQSSFIPIENQVTWNKVLFANKYSLQISTDSLFVNSVIEFSDITNNEFTTEELDYFTTYFWRIRAHNDVFDGPWSDVWSFTTTSAFDLDITNGETICEGSSLELQVVANINFEPDNVFVIQFSEESDNFDNFISLAEIETDISFDYQTILSDTLETETQYLIRVKSTNPEAYSNIYSLVIYPVPTADFITDKEQICGSDSLTVTYTGNATQNAQFYWSFDEGNIVSTGEEESYEIVWETPGEKNITLSVSENNCNSENMDISIPVYIPVSDFYLDEIVCENEHTNIEFSGVASDSAVYVWTFDNGIIVSGENSGPYTVYWETLGSKTITLTIDDNDCLSSTTERTLNHHAYPTINIIAPQYVCYERPAEISCNGSASEFANYNWNFDEGLVNQGSGSGPYQILWTSSGIKTVSLEVNDSGCIKSDSISLTVNEQTHAISICIVTVNNQNKNQIVWETPETNPYDSILVYKESTISDLFVEIGRLKSSDSFFYIDEESNPSQNSSRYKLLVIDTCGYQSELSDFHKTMHLTISSGIGGTWNLIWDKYEGFDYPSFEIYRGTSTNSLTKIAEIASNSFTYTDLSPPEDVAYYQILAINPNPCGLDEKKNSKENFSNTRSNIVSSQESSIRNDILSNNINIFPNPINDFFQIQSDYSTLIQSIIITSLDGKVLFTEELFKQNSLIDISDFATGIYILRINFPDTHVYYRIIKE